MECVSREVKHTSLTEQILHILPTNSVRKLCEIRQSLSQTRQKGRCSEAQTLLTKICRPPAGGAAP